MGALTSDTIDELAAIGLGATLVLVLGVHAARSVAAGRFLVETRVEREHGLPLLGRAPMHAVYRALGPLARGLAAVGVSANAVTACALLLAVGAASAFAVGSFGLGAAAAALSGLADAVDGLVARASSKATGLGRVFDTTVDRYVDALLLGGIAVYVRRDVWLLVLVLAAIVASFMVSYASSVERELGAPATPGPMRRPHRLAYLVAGAALVPVAARVFSGGASSLLPLLAAVFAIATVGNVSAIRRLVRAAGAAKVGREEARP